MKRIKDKDPHKFAPPRLARVQNFIAVYGVAALIILLWNTERPEDWLLMFVSALVGMLLTDIVFDRMVMKPLKIEWLKEHIRKYHPEDIDKLDMLP